jgi:hypothetical protein
MFTERYQKEWLQNNTCCASYRPKNVGDFVFFLQTLSCLWWQKFPIF